MNAPSTNLAGRLSSTRGLLATVLSAVTCCGALLVGAVTSTSAASASTGILGSGGVLRSGQSISSPSGGYVLVMQSDGNLVEYQPGGVAVWASDTAGQPGNYVVMQSDGNLVVYSSANQWRWQSGTEGFSGAYLALQSDANLVIYQSGHPLWARFGWPAQNYAQEIMPRYGWSVASQYGCLNNLWTRESNWQWNATNPSSGAYGIPQALPANKMAAEGPDWQTDAFTQVRWGLDYISSRYGNPCNAWAHEQQYGWYGPRR